MKCLYIIFCFLTVVYAGCTECSRSGRRSLNSASTAQMVNERHSTKNVVKMIKENGVYQIPIEINGVEMSFIFDTGAGLISISQVEAGFLYKQGKLKEEDIVGKANFIDANGDITEGTIIILRSVKIGEKEIHNIEASVVHNMVAPLLLGQSALEKFGKISIDNIGGQLTFE